MIEWEMGSDGWDETTDQVTPADRTYSASPVANQLNRHWWYIAATVLVVLVGIGASVLRWQADRNTDIVKANVQGVLDQEMWALESGNWDLYEAQLDPKTPPRWFRDQQGRFIRQAQRGPFRADVLDLALIQPDLALAEIRLDPPGDEAYRETRAYRQIDNSWRHTAPPAGSLWLNPATRETENLRFVFHPNDAATLIPLMPGLQELYSQLLDDFHLTPLPTRRQLDIVLSVQPAGSAMSGTGQRYDLSSQAGASADQIQHELGSQLTDRVMHQFYAEADDLAFVLDGIHQWEVSTWLGNSDPRSTQRVAEVLADKPVVPLLMVRPAHFSPPTTTSLVETIVDYLVWRNGRSVINKLVDGVKQYDTWPELIEAGLGLSYQDVDRGWSHFLAQRYPSAQDDVPDDLHAQLLWMLELEKRAVETRHQELFRSLLDPRAPSEWKAESLRRFWSTHTIEPKSVPVNIGSWGHQRDVAWATLEYQSAGTDLEHPTADSWIAPPLRVYRMAEHRWFLTSPDTAFDGPWLTTRTQHIEFRYREPDRNLIRALGPRVDALYEQVVHDFNIAYRVPERLTLALTYSLNPVEYRRAQPDEVPILSPWLLSGRLGAAEQFQLQVGYAVVDALLNSVENLRGRQGHNPLLNGMITWEVEEWGNLPNWTSDKTETLRRGLTQDTLPSLSNYPSMMDPGPTRMQSYASTTIAEYVAATYGRHRFSDLLSAAEEHQSLRQLVLTALGTTIEMFEAGWRSYLEKEYDHAATDQTSARGTTSSD